MDRFSPAGMPCRRLLGALVLLACMAARPAGAGTQVEGRVRLSSGEPAVAAQVRLFDLTDLRATPLTATTDGAGRFELPLAGPRALSAVPHRFGLGPNYPNPFNPSTIIPYQLPASDQVRLEVFNILGQRVATLVDGVQPAGFHTARWNATDAAGRAVAAGVYLYRLRGGGVSLTERMVLVDGQAGLPAPSGGPGTGRARGEGSAIYGLIVSGPGLVPYVDPAVPVVPGPIDVVVQDSKNAPLAKAASAGRTGIRGDVDNNGRVDLTDALLVLFYSIDPSTVMPNDGDIALGDVNADGVVDPSDGLLIATYSLNPSDPQLPAGIGALVAPPTISRPTMIYWTEAVGRIQRSRLDGSRVEVLLTGLDDPDGLALDMAAGKMYWADYGTGKIQRANLDGSQVEDLLTTGLVIPGGLVLDLAGGKMYWTDLGTDRIQRANLDGSQVEDLVATGLDSPFELALDLAGGRMYWTDWGTHKIQRANLDGSQVEDLVTGLSDPLGLALDLAGGRMYWTDSGTDKIQRANLDGSQIEDLVTGLSDPYGLALDLARGKMYWSDYSVDRIQRANLDGSQIENLLGIEVDLPGDIALGGPGGRMYWTDWTSNRIQRAHRDGSGVEDLVAAGLDNPYAVALDRAGGKMYWTDYGTTRSSEPTSTDPTSKTSSPPD